MQICKTCVLDERFPGIRFTDDGICNACASAHDPAEQRRRKNKCREEFERLLEDCAGKGSYDCLVAYSGGKDSTYTLHELKTTYNLRILAFSYDNWFQSHTARQNIRAVIRNMNVNHLTVTPSFEAVRSMTLASMKTDAYSAKALTRASCICTSCISLIRLVGLRLAIEQNIPILAFGMSPGQAPIRTSIVKTNVGLTRSMQQAFLHPLTQRVAELVGPFLLDDRHFDQADRFPYSANPLAFLDYNESTVVRIAAQYGWTKPDDTDANSTNCLLNAFANQVHMKRFGINPYTSEIAALVRNGSMTRAQGLEKLAEPLPMAQIAAVREALGIGSL